LHRLLPGLGDPTPIRVRPGTRADGQTLAQLNLRGHTGARVLAVAPDGAGVLTPTGHETLYAGDLLAVAGTVEAIGNARALLEETDA